MAFNDGSHRWRDDFPQLFAAWLATQSAAHRATVQVRNAAPASSPLTTLLLLAGSVAVGLGIVALNNDRPQTAAQGSTERTALLSLTGREVQPLEMDLAVDRMALLIADWDERTYQFWESTPLISPAVVAAIPDDWTAAHPRPETEVSAYQPYYTRAEIRDFHEFTAATTAEEVPLLYASAEFNRHVGVTIERSPAALDHNGALAYTLNVRNLDNNPVEHVRVIESMPIEQAEQVLDTFPPAYMSSEGALIWQLADLQPRESRQLMVTLNAAKIAAPLQTVAALDVETQVSVSTAVIAAAFPEPETETIVPELALPAEEPVFPEQPFGEPISPLLADESVVPEDTVWSSYDPVAAQQDDAPIEPLIAQDAESDGVQPFEPIVPQYEPIVPDSEPIVPEFAPFDPQPREPVERDIADEPVVPAAEPTPAPRPLPLEPAHTPRPLLSLKASTARSVRTGDVVTTVYEITNTGDAAADGVILTVYVPPELQHKYGKEVEHRIDQLPPGTSHRARLLTRASSTGTAELEAVLSVDGALEEESRVSVRVLNGRPAGTPSARPR